MSREWSSPLSFKEKMVEGLAPHLEPPLRLNAPIRKNALTQTSTTPDDENYTYPHE